MTEIYGVVSPKGGVGKTTASLCIASVCAGLLQKKTLLVDADGQNDCTRRIRNKTDYDLTIFDLIVRQAEPQDVLQKSKFENLYLIPSDPKLHKLSAKDYPDDLVPQYLIREVVDPIASYFDYIIIDSPGFYGDLLRATICAANYLLVPISLENDCVNAFDTTKMLADALEKNGLTRLKSPVKTFFYKMPPKSELTKTQASRVRELKSSYKDNYLGIDIPSSRTKVLTSNNANSTLFYSFPKSNVSKKYIKLTQELTGEHNV